MKSVLVGTILGLSMISGSAFAAGSPVVFNGTYQLRCQSADLVLHINLGGATAAGSASFADDITVPLDCDGISPEEITTFEEETTKNCVNAGLPEDFCQTLSQDLAVAISEFNDNALGFIPVSVKLTVQSVTNFWNQVFGIYPMLGQNTLSDGSSSSTSYILNNNTSSFGVAGIQLFNSASSGQLGCADVAVGAINGALNRTNGSLQAQFGIDRSLYCAAANEVGIIAGSIGLTFRGNVKGQK